MVDTPVLNEDDKRNEKSYSFYFNSTTIFLQTFVDDDSGCARHDGEGAV